MTTAVIVLNASYEPISRTRLPRAVAMVQRGVAVIEDAVPGRFLRYAGGFLPVPRTLRLVRYVKVRIAHLPAPWSRRGVLARDGHRCGYCTDTGDTIDHIVPRAQGGTSTWLNTVAACRKCNGRKADRTPQQAAMMLRVDVYAPTRGQLHALT